MAKRTIVWLDFAKQDRKDIYSYWNSRNKSISYSKKLQQAVVKSYAIIDRSPLANPSFGNSDERFILIASNYLLVYSFNYTYIIIHAFWDARQNPDKLTKRIK